MNAESIAEYVTKLETVNEESREKIEQLKKLLTEANDERVAALEELNGFRDKKRYKSLYETTTKPLIDDEYDSAEDSDYEESSEEESDDEFFTTQNNDIYEMLTDLAEEETSHVKRMALHRAADAVFYLPFRITSARELAAGPNKVSGIGPKIAKKIDDYLRNPNKKLADLFLKVPVGGHDQPHIGGYGLGPPYPFEGPGLYNAEELGLQHQAHLGYFIQE